MKGKVVYAVASSGRDEYSAMARVSIATVRLSNPDLPVVVVCDSISESAMRSLSDPLLDDIDALVVCETPSGDTLFRSRFTKTKVRSLVSGPILFLDCDTVIRSGLSDIFLDPGCDIAGSPNHSTDDFRAQILGKAPLEIAAKMKWNFRNDVYINTGVLYFNDTPLAAQFGVNWHNKWLKGIDDVHDHRDQPAFNAQLYETDASVKILPHKYNAQVKMSPSVSEEAVIWHFYASVGGKKITAFEALVARVMGGETISKSEIESLVRRRHPWRRDSWIDEWAARIVSRKGALDAYDELWFQGNRLTSLAYRVKQFWPLRPLARAAKKVLRTKAAP